MGDARDGVARFNFAGRYGRGHQGSRAMSRNGSGDDLQSLAGAFHHVVAPRPVYVDVDKARHNGFSARVDFTRAARQVDFPAPADGGNLAPLNDHEGIGDFFEGSEGPVGVDNNRLHMDGIILLEMRRIGNQRSSGVLQARTFFRYAGCPSNLYPQQGSCHWEGRGATLCGSVGAPKR